MLTVTFNLGSLFLISLNFFLDGHHQKMKWQVEALLINFVKKKLKKEYHE